MIRIVTDSSANISQQEAAALGIEVIPLTVIFGTEAYLEGPEITADAFYERLTGGEFPHTSQPSSAQLSEAFARWSCWRRSGAVCVCSRRSTRSNTCTRAAGWARTP